MAKGARALPGARGGWTPADDAAGTATGGTGLGERDAGAVSATKRAGAGGGTGGDGTGGGGGGTRARTDGAGDVTAGGADDGAAGGAGFEPGGMVGRTAAAAGGRGAADAEIGGFGKTGSGEAGTAVIAGFAGAPPGVRGDGAGAVTAAAAGGAGFAVGGGVASGGGAPDAGGTGPEAITAGRAARAVDDDPPIAESAILVDRNAFWPTGTGTDDDACGPGMAFAGGDGDTFTGGVVTDRGTAPATGSGLDATTPLPDAGGVPLLLGEAAADAAADGLRGAGGAATVFAVGTVTDRAGTSDPSSHSVETA